MGINIALAKSIAKTTSIMYESIGIINISFVEPNIFHFTLADSSTKDVTIANLVSFTQVDKTKLDSLDETVLSKFTFSGGKLLYDGLPIESGGITNLLGFTTDDLVESATKKYVTPTEKSTWDAKSNFDGNYNSLTNKPTIDKTTIGLGNVDNTSDLNKPISTSTQTALDLKVDKETGKGLIDNSVLATLNNHTINTANPHSVTKTQVGLGNVDNTSDLNKPISTATQTALNLKADTSSVNTSLGNKVDKVVGSSLVADTEISKIHTHSNKATLDGITSENITSWTGKAEVSAIPTTTSQLTNNSNFAVDSSYVHTDNNYTTAEKTKVGKITTTGDGSKYLNDAGNYITVSGGGGGASIDDTSASPITTYSSTKISTDYATKSELNGKANTSHSHTISDVTNLQTSLDGKVDDNQVLTNVPSGALFTDTVTTINSKTGAIAKSDIVALGIPAQDTIYSVATQSVNGLESSADKTKLDGITTSATKTASSLTNGNIKINDVETIVYTHPSTHSPSIIVQDSSNRFTTDTEKTSWNSASTNSHTHANKSTLDTYTQTEVNLADAVSKKHSHTNNTVLDNTTASYTTTEQTKLSGIATSANNYTLPVATTSIGGVKSGTDITVDINGNVSVNDDSHNHIISNVDGLQTALDNKNILTSKSKNAFIMNQVVNTNSMLSASLSSGVEYRGVASLFSDKYTNPSTLTGVIEATTLIDNDRVDVWYQDTGALPLRYGYCDTESVQSFTRYSTKDPVIPVCRFPFTFKYNGKYYTFGGLTNNYETFEIYLWESADKLNWTMLNGGLPIINKSASGIWKYIWNTSVVVIGDEWHVWVEAGSLASQADVGIVYTHGNLANLSLFNTNKSTSVVIQGGGNPSAIYIPERSSIMILHGEIYETGDVTGEQNYWTLRASYVNTSSDLSLTASYTKTSKDKFCIVKSGIHISDPQIVELPNTKSSKLLLIYSYDQNCIYQTYADVTILDLYDALISYKKSTASSSAEAITAITLNSGFTNLGSGFETARYYKDSIGINHVSGFITLACTAYAPMFTLPVGYRPACHLRRMAVIDIGGTLKPTELDIWTTGVVSETYGNTTGTLLLDFSFRIGV